MGRVMFTVATIEFEQGASRQCEGNICYWAYFVRPYSQHGYLKYMHGLK